MAGTGLATTRSTRPVLLLSRRFELGAPAQARPYAHGQTLHRAKWQHSGLFWLHPLFLDFYIRLLCILTLESNIVGPDGSRLPSTTGGGGGEVTGRAGADATRVSADAGGRIPETGAGSSVHANSRLGDGSFAATIHCTSTSTSCSYTYSCK